MPLIPPTDELLSHLTRCQECGYYVGTALMCKGQGDESKKGFWYEKCVKNAQPTPNSCTYYRWLLDRPHGKAPGGKRKCPGWLCRQGKKPGSVNGECTFGVCANCCRHIQAHLTIVRSCQWADHRKGVVYPEPQTAAGGGDATKTPSHGRGRPRKVKHAPDDTTMTKNAEGGDASDSVPRPTRRPPPEVKSYAMPVGPSYKARLSQIDAEKVLDEDIIAARTKQDWASARQHKVSLRWWTKDGERPDFVDVPIDNPSAFHLKDSPLLVEDYHCDTQKFQYYDAKKREWYNGSKLSAPQDLKKLTDDDLCYRSLGVTWGIGMPGQTKKRPAPEDSTDQHFPRRPQAPFADGPTDLSHRAFATFTDGLSTPARSHSPTAMEPPLSGSTAFPDDDETDPFADAFDFDFTPRSFTCADHPLSATINGHPPPLPALFPSDIRPTPSSSMTMLPSTSTSSLTGPCVPLDLTAAPRGCTYEWPWRYVCDMAAGFDAIRRLEDGPERMKIPAAFEQVFQTEYKQSTYRDQMRAWRAAGLVSGEREHWISYQRTEAGEWLTFMKKWHQDR